MAIGISMVEHHPVPRARKRAMMPAMLHLTSVNFLSPMSRIHPRRRTRTNSLAASGWSFGETSDLQLEVEGERLVGSIDGKVVIEARDADASLGSGGVALVCEEGRIGCDEVAIGPLS